jgi:hypothetical protein
MYATRMPLVIISWLKLTNPPRIFFGASSPMYIGDTNDAVPTEIPSTNRATIRTQTVGDRALQIAPTAKMQPEIFVRRRPMAPAR